MIWLDVILLSPLLWGAYTGFKKGLVAQILGLISLLMLLQVSYAWLYFNNYFSEEE